MIYCVIFDMSSIYGTSLVTAFFLSYRQKRNISRIDFFLFSFLPCGKINIKRIGCRLKNKNIPFFISNIS